MKDHFDLIALPKGQASSGPIQTSGGHWVIVIPCDCDLKTMIRMIVDAMTGKPPTPEEIAAAAAYLSGPKEKA
jgi:hypothetical protein